MPKRAAGAFAIAPASASPRPRFGTVMLPPFEEAGGAPSMRSGCRRRFVSFFCASRDDRLGSVVTLRSELSRGPERMPGTGVPGGSVSCCGSSFGLIGP